MFRLDRRSLVLGLAATAVAGPAADAADAPRAELVMIERDGCSWCQRWHQEIGVGYPKSEEGRKAPLRVTRDVEAAKLGVVLRAPVTMAPTFVLVEDGREVGRIVGYPGAEFFYGLLGALMQKRERGAAASGLSSLVDLKSS